MREVDAARRAGVGAVVSEPQGSPIEGEKKSPAASGPRSQRGAAPFATDATESQSRAQKVVSAPPSASAAGATSLLAMRAAGNWAPVIEIATVDEMAAQDQPVTVAFQARDAENDPLDVSLSRATYRAAGASTYDSVEASLEHQSGNFYALRFTPKAAGEYAFTIVATEAGRDRGNTTSVDFRLRVRTGGDEPNPLWQVSPVWVGENDYASKGVTESAPLKGVQSGAKELKADHIWVVGKEPFTPGHKPLDPHSSRTYYHDSFTQAELYKVMRRMAERYDSFDLGMTYGQLVAAKSHQSHARANANAMEQVNAYYMPNNETTNFGVAIDNGRPVWDLGADSNVTLHEAGHYNLDHLVPGLSYWGDAGAMHEGYGDAQAAFLTRDPEISEDFSKVEGKPGEPLRNVVNNATFENTTSEVHDRGKVFGAMMWEIGEALHEAIVGKPRQRTPVDAEALNADAADTALKILWTFPLYLGSRAPSRADFIRSVHQAVDSLSSAGKLPSKVNIKQLHAAIDKEAKKRGFNTEPVESVGDPIPLAGIGTGRGPDVEGLRAAGLDPQIFSAALVSEVHGPNGEVIQRYEVSRRVNVEGRSGVPVKVPIEDDLLTVIKQADGTYFAQVGLLKKYAEQPKPEIKVPAMMASANGLEIASSTAQLGLPVTEEELLGQLRDYAAADLSHRMHPVRRDIVSGISTIEPPKTTPTDDHLAREAQAMLKSDAAPQGELVWREGVLNARLELGTLTYYAKITPDGTLRTPEAQKAIICDASHFDH